MSEVVGFCKQSSASLDAEYDREEYTVPRTLGGLAIGGAAGAGLGAITDAAASHFPGRGAPGTMLGLGIGALLGSIVGNMYGNKAYAKEKQGKDISLLRSFIEMNRPLRVTSD